MMAKVSTLAITTSTRSNQIVGKNRKICTPLHFIQSTYVKIQKSHIERAVVSKLSMPQKSLLSSFFDFPFVSNYKNVTRSLQQ